MSSKPPRSTAAPAKKSAAKPAPKADPVLTLDGAEAWSAWLRQHHASSTGVWLQIPKKAAGHSLTYAAALEAALTWGWIDSQKKALDAAAWLQRFSPRTARSPWSKINRAKAEALIAEGRMEPRGLAEVDRAKADGRWERAYDGARSATVPDDLAQALAANPEAKAFFDALDSANRFAILYRVTTAKLPATRADRIARFVGMCARRETLHRR